MRRRAIWGVSLLIGVLAGSLPVGTRAEMARWDLDPGHSIIEFRVAHMVVSKTAGRFMDYSGVVEMDADAHRFKTIEATINTASVNTNHEKRDAHLRNVDFFDVEKYPVMTYKLKSYKKTDEGYQAIGDLTLRGVTKEITLAGTFNGVTKDPWGNTRAGFTGEGTINRKDFGMVWNKTLDSGGLVVGDEVQIRLDIECIKAKKP
ncbi:MAG TPA: YceI family protein [Nitrospira sp.]|nr:YceI family protein [Nitrospira sp.]